MRNPKTLERELINRCAFGLLAEKKEREKRQKKRERQLKTWEFMELSFFAGFIGCVTGFVMQVYNLLGFTGEGVLIGFSVYCGLWYLVMREKRLENELSLNRR